MLLTDIVHGYSGKLPCLPYVSIFSAESLELSRFYHKLLIFLHSTPQSLTVIGKLSIVLTFVCSRLHN